MQKIITVKELKSFLPEIKKGTLVLIGGCFDILHPGHIQFIKNAKNTGDTLLVLLESDEFIKEKKGENRPVNSQLKRAQTLSKLEEVDFILLLPHLKTDRDYYEMTNLIQPDIIAVTKNDPALIHKKKQAEEVGGQVIEVIERLPKHSTTQIINNNI